MIETPEQALRRRREQNSQEKAYLKLGWRSTGDIPYIIANSLRDMKWSPLRGLKRNVNAGLIQPNILTFLGDVIKKQSEKYAQENVRRIGRKTFVSPDLIKKMEEEIKLFYKLE